MNIPDPKELLARVDFVLSSVDQWPEARDLPVTKMMRELATMVTVLYVDHLRYRWLSKRYELTDELIDEAMKP